jgi:hypothetical protein
MTIPTFEEAYARAREGSPFSNGDEGYGWMGTWCGRCIHDKPARNDDPGNGCPLILVAYSQRTPSEWLDGPRDERGLYGISDQYQCVMFRPEDDPGPEEPTPIPDPPGQDALFPRDGFERPGRMFADTKPQEVSVRG